MAKQERVGHVSQTEAKAARVARQQARLAAKASTEKPSTVPSDALVSSEPALEPRIPSVGEPIIDAGEVVLVENPQPPVEPETAVSQSENAPKKGKLRAKAKSANKPAVTLSDTEAPKRKRRKKTDEPEKIAVIETPSEEELPKPGEETIVFQAPIQHAQIKEPQPAEILEPYEKSKLSENSKNVGKLWLRWLKERQADDITPPEQLRENWRRILLTFQTTDATTIRWSLEQVLEGMGHDKYTDKFGRLRDNFYRSLIKQYPDYIKTIEDVPGIMDRVYYERLPSVAASYLIAFSVLSNYSYDEKEELLTHVKDRANSPQKSVHMLDVLTEFIANKAHFQTQK